MVFNVLIDDLKRGKSPSNLTGVNSCLRIIINNHTYNMLVKPTWVVLESDLEVIISSGLKH